MEDKEKKAQEMYIEFQMLDQHVKQLQKQLQAITQQLMEFEATSMSLESLQKVSQGKEILVPLSSGIFTKAEIKDTSQLLVNVGANIVVQKDIQSTKQLMAGQTEEIKRLQSRIMEDPEKMTEKAANIEGELQALISEK